MLKLKIVALAELDPSLLLSRSSTSMWRLSCMAMATNSTQRSFGKFCAYDAKNTQRRQRIWQRIQTVCQFQEDLMRSKRQPVCSGKSNIGVAPEPQMSQTARCS
jgi:hypothetical protein